MCRKRREAAFARLQTLTLLVASGFSRSLVLMLFHVLALHVDVHINIDVHDTYIPGIRVHVAFTFT